MGGGGGESGEGGEGGVPETEFPFNSSTMNARRIADTITSIIFQLLLPIWNSQMGFQRIAIATKIEAQTQKYAHCFLRIP